MADRCVETRGCREEQRLVQRTSQCPPCDRRKTTCAVRTSKIDHHDCTFAPKGLDALFVGEATRDLLAQRSNHQPLFLKAEPSSQVHSATQAIKSPTEPDQIPEPERVAGRHRMVKMELFSGYFGLVVCGAEKPATAP